MTNIINNKIINDVVIIDGLTRSGKFYLGKLISGIDRLEYFVNNSEAERMLAISKAGTINAADVSSILAITLNEAIYNMAIGRNINMRHDDASSITNSHESKLYIDRQNYGVSGKDGLEAVIDQGRASVFIFHQSLRSINVVKGAVPEAKIINLRRHPIDLTYSWIKRGWGYRYGNDPLSFSPVYAHNGSTIPYFAFDWADEYISSNEHDRVIKSIVYLSEEEAMVINKKQHKICCVYYDNLVDNPEKEIDKICSFLDRTAHKNIERIIERETRDKDFLAQRKEKLDYIRKDVSDTLFFERLLELGRKYEETISVGE